jgi:hypothetical protein
MANTTEDVKMKICLSLIKSIREEINPDFWFNITKNGLLMMTSDSHGSHKLEMKVTIPRSEDKPPCIEHGSNKFPLENPECMSKVVQYVARELLNKYIANERKTHNNKDLNDTKIKEMIKKYVNKKDYHL